MPKIISIGHPITEKEPIENLKILSPLAPFISKTEKANSLNFLSDKYFSKHLKQFDIHWSSIVEIMGHQTCNFGSLNTAHRDLKTDQGKQHQTC